MDSKFMPRRGKSMSPSQYVFHVERPAYVKKECLEQKTSRKGGVVKIKYIKETFSSNPSYVISMLFLIYCSHMIRIAYSGEYLEKIKKEVFEAFDFSYAFFKLEIPDVIVRVHKNRAEFDKQLGTKTANWLVANASDNGEIDILNPAAIEKESSHDKSEFLQILKHEFTHLFVDGLTNGKSVPKWLDEGLAAYIAKQHQNDKGPIYFEENFCQKLDTPREWDNNVNYDAYTIAALFVDFLISKYSFDKIKELLSSIDKSYYYPNFKKTFLAVYQKELEDVEQLFISEINGKRHS